MTEEEKRSISGLIFNDLLTPEQRAELQADLAKMAKQRRQAEDASSNIPMA